MENVISTASISSGNPVDNPIDRTDLEQYFAHALRTFIDLRAIKSPYYGFESLTDKWKEYDRCYRIEAKGTRNNHEYDGWSNIVTSDFHESIEIKRAKEMKALFGGADLFTTKATKFSTLSDAAMARRLVEYNHDRIDKFQSENNKAILDRRKYGTAFVYTPWKVEERYVNTVSLPFKQNKDGDIATDKSGKPISDNKLNDFEITEEVKYTDFKHIQTKRVYLNPNIEDIQKQECIFIMCTFSYSELKIMELEGTIDKDMADYVMENYRDYHSELGDDDDAKVNEDAGSMYDRKLKSFDLYLTYKKIYDEDGRCHLYECIYMWRDKIIGMREYPTTKIPLLKTCFIPVADYAYGLGQGDQIYPLYIAMCARINQVFDLETKEIKGGGFVDSEALPAMSSWAPGQWVRVNGLSAKLSTNGKPILTMSEMDGSRPASTALDIVPILERKLRGGSGTTEIMSGQPTHSQVDRTAAGLTLIAEQAEDRLGSELLIYQDEILKEHAELAYDNYGRFLIPEIDLPKMFDEEDLYYVDNRGQKQPISISGALRKVTFTFLAANRVIDREEKIGKITRFMQIIMQMASVSKELGNLLLEKTNFLYLIQEIADSLDITDLDRLFPGFNPIGELMKERAANDQLSAQNNAMQQGIQMTLQKLSEIKDQSAIDIIQDVMVQAAQAQQEASGNVQ